MKAWLIIAVLLISACAAAEAKKEDCTPMDVYMELPNGDVRQYFKCTATSEQSRGKSNPVIQAKPMWTVQSNRYRGNFSIRKFNSGENQ
jgi:hypothetical protein